MAVLRQRDRESPEGNEERMSSWDDHLVIVDLASPASRETAFVNALEQMAKALHRWKSIVYLKTSSPVESASPGHRISAIEELIGTKLNNVREIYTVREWQLGNQLLFKAFPSATKICFGDSIGIYLAPTYMRPRAGRIRSFVRHLSSVFVKNSENGSSRQNFEFPRVPADWYYLTLPHAFDPVPSSKIKVTDVSFLRHTMMDLIPLLPSALISDLKKRLDGRRLIVLLGSNFSEQGIMTPEAEIAAYVEYLQEQGLDPNSLVLLKPHPRDRVEKLRKLEIALAGAFYGVFTLSDDFGFFLPLEALLIEIRSMSAMDDNIDVLTFSSACLAAKHILHISPRIGFGATLVRKYFNAPFVEARLAHERQLVAACGEWT